MHPCRRGWSLVAQEAWKHRRYAVREQKTQRRNTRALFVPVVAWTYGGVGDEAADYFAGLEAEAKRRLPAYAKARAGWLWRAVCAAAVYGTARGVLDAYAPPDGQERAHFRGRVAAAADA